MQKIGSALLCIIMACPFLPLYTTAQNGNSKAFTVELTPYEHYLSENTYEPATESVSFACGQVLLQKGDSYTFEVQTQKDALWNIAPQFSNYSAADDGYKISLLIDGKAPFDDCEKLRLHTIWKNEGEVRVLANGDEVNPSQSHIEGVMSENLSDNDGISAEPYLFALSAGQHTVTVVNLNNTFILNGLALNTPTQCSDYKSVSSQYGKTPYYDGEQIVLEAEKPLYKNAYDLTSRSDSGSASVSPSSPINSVINYIGGSTWSEPGQEIVWELNAPKTALYKIGFSFKQNTVSGGSVYRNLKIDGKTPFTEAGEIGFSYATKWQFNSFANENGEDYLILLEKGKHTLSLSVTLSDIAQVYKELKPIVEKLGELYLDMAMITGENPDSNRDYELHKQIPDFVSILEDVESRCDSLYNKIGDSLKANGGLRGALKNMSRILNTMRGSLYQSHLQIPAYYTAYQTLSSWLYDIKDMPLSLDQIIIAAPEAPYDTSHAGFFGSLRFGFLRFINSYSSDYSKVENTASGDVPTIKIWVNWGRDQVKVLNTLIQDSFVRENNINVTVEQVNATLVQGVISGNSPDLYLHMARTEPVNLAMRGVLYDLTKFEDYDETMSLFQPGAELPYKYHGGCYALPDTQSFYVMFYRKDILEELGLELPQTWSDFLTATGILQRHNMNTYLPYIKITAATTVNTGAGGLSIFPTMLLQNGGKVYNDELNATAFFDAVSVKAFTSWTDYYTQYSLDQEANFYQKFRIGTIPLGISVYTQYLTFAAAAPEIDGKWAIAPIPGVMKEDGVIDRTCSGAGTGCAIMKSSKNKDAAWAFLKWWVSPETQYSNSAENEAILGETGRVASATVGAVEKLSWETDALDVILKQWQSVSEIPEVPGSYFVSRSIDQAFWAVKNGKASPKEAIRNWSEICDKEIARKIAEYS